jgi:hypothetical protein
MRLNCAEKLKPISIGKSGFYLKKWLNKMRLLNDFGRIFKKEMYYGIVSSNMKIPKKVEAKRKMDTHT